MKRWWPSTVHAEMATSSQPMRNTYSCSLPIGASRLSQVVEIQGSLGKRPVAHLLLPPPVTEIAFMSKATLLSIRMAHEALRATTSPANGNAPR